MGCARPPSRRGPMPQLRSDARPRLRGKAPLPRAPDQEPDHLGEHRHGKGPAKARHPGFLREATRTGALARTRGQGAGRRGIPSDLVQYDLGSWPRKDSRRTYPDSLDATVERLRRTPESVSWAEIFQFVPAI